MNRALYKEGKTSDCIRKGRLRKAALGCTNEEHFKPDYFPKDSKYPFTRHS